MTEKNNLKNNSLWDTPVIDVVEGTENLYTQYLIDHLPEHNEFQSAVLFSQKMDHLFHALLSKDFSKVSVSEFINSKPPQLSKNIWNVLTNVRSLYLEELLPYDPNRVGMVYDLSSYYTLKGQYLLDLESDVENTIACYKDALDAADHIFDKLHIMFNLSNLYFHELHDPITSQTYFVRIQNLIENNNMTYQKALFLSQKSKNALYENIPRIEDAMADLTQAVNIAYQGLNNLDNRLIDLKVVYWHPMYIMKNFIDIYALQRNLSQASIVAQQLFDFAKSIGEDALLNKNLKFSWQMAIYSVFLKGYNHYLEGKNRYQAKSLMKELKDYIETMDLQVSLSRNTETIYYSQALNPLIDFFEGKTMSRSDLIWLSETPDLLKGNDKVQFTYLLVLGMLQYEDPSFEDKLFHIINSNQLNFSYTQKLLFYLVLAVMTEEEKRAMYFSTAYRIIVTYSLDTIDPKRAEYYHKVKTMVEVGAAYVLPRDYLIDAITDEMVWSRSLFPIDKIRDIQLDLNEPADIKIEEPMSYENEKIISDEIIAEVHSDEEKPDEKEDENLSAEVTRTQNTLDTISEILSVPITETEEDGPEEETTVETNSTENEMLELDDQEEITKETEEPKDEISEILSIPIIESEDEDDEEEEIEDITDVDFEDDKEEEEIEDISDIDFEDDKEEEEIEDITDIDFEEDEEEEEIEDLPDVDFENEDAIDEKEISEEVKEDDETRDEIAEILSIPIMESDDDEEIESKDELVISPDVENAAMKTKFDLAKPLKNIPDPKNIEIKDQTPILPKDETVEKKSPINQTNPLENMPDPKNIGSKSIDDNIKLSKAKKSTLLDELESESYENIKPTNVETSEQEVPIQEDTHMEETVIDEDSNSSTDRTEKIDATGQIMSNLEDEINDKEIEHVSNDEPENFQESSVEVEKSSLAEDRIETDNFTEEEKEEDAATEQEQTDTQESSEAVSSSETTLDMMKLRELRIAVELNEIQEQKKQQMEKKSLSDKSITQEGPESLKPDENSDNISQVEMETSEGVAFEDDNPDTSRNKEQGNAEENTESNVDPSIQQTDEMVEPVDTNETHIAGYLVEKDLTNNSNKMVVVEDTDSSEVQVREELSEEIQQNVSESSSEIDTKNSTKVIEPVIETPEDTMESETDEMSPFNSEGTSVQLNYMSYIKGIDKQDEVIKFHEEMFELIDIYNSNDKKGATETFLTSPIPPPIDWKTLSKARQHYVDDESKQTTSNPIMLTKGVIDLAYCYRIFGMVKWKVLGDAKKAHTYILKAQNTAKHPLDKEVNTTILAMIKEEKESQ